MESSEQVQEDLTMWKRLMNIFRALFGWLIRSAEDPKLLLQQATAAAVQAMDDLRMQILKMNAQAAEVVMHQKMLEGQAERTAHNIADLEKKVEMAVKGGEKTKQAALTLIGQLEREKAHMEEVRTGLAMATANSQKILEMRAAFERKIQQQIEECRTQMSCSEMADAESQMVSLMGSFKVGDASDTLDNVTGKIDEKLARARAQMEVAGESTDAQIAQVELQTEAASAEGLYGEYQKQYGLVADDPGAETTKTMASIPVATTPPAEEAKWVEVDTNKQ